MRHRPSIHITIGIGMLLILEGCAYPRYGGSEGYVLEMGDARKITEWGLGQANSLRITHAYDALVVILVRTDRRDQRDAILGVEAIQKKLEQGWPGADWIDGDT